MNSIKKPVVIFGNMASASTSKYYLDNDSDHAVIGFTVDKENIISPKHEGLDVIPFENILNEYPPQEVSILFPVGYSTHDPRGTNVFRRNRYECIKSMGYEFINYISSKAIVASNVVIGDNVLIYEGAIIQPFVQIGSNVIIRSGSNIGHHCNIGSHTFIASEVTIGGKTNLDSEIFIGLNSTVSNSVNIASGSFIAANSFINQDTQVGSDYRGVPARRYE